MADPHEVLGLTSHATAEQVRQRYLELVRTYTPEQYPQRFAEIQAAYDQLRNPAQRIEATMFDPEAGESIEDLIRQASKRLTAERLPTQVLLRLDKLSG